MKAALQRIETTRAINFACATQSNKIIDLRDLLLGIIKSFRTNPKETWNTIKPIIIWAYKNNDLALQTFFQIFVKYAPKEQVPIT